MLILHVLSFACAGSVLQGSLAEERDQVRLSTTSPFHSARVSGANLGSHSGLQGRGGSVGSSRDGEVSSPTLPPRDGEVSSPVSPVSFLGSVGDVEISPYKATDEVGGEDKELSPRGMDDLDGSS